MRITLKRTLIAGVAACLAGAILAQDPEPPSFRAGARLIEISVAATDRGKPVLDLTKEDFRIRDNGRDQEIRLFIAPAANSLNDARSGSQPQPEAAEPGSAAIVLDWLNMGFAEKAYARQKLIDMLRAIGLQDRVAIFANFRTLRFLHDFSGNNAALLESLAALRPGVDSPASRFSIDLFGTNEMDEFKTLDMRLRIDATQRNVLPIVELLRRQTGRRSLIWISTSFNVPIAQLIRSNITLYTVDARGVQIKPLLPAGASSGAQAQQAFEARLDQGMRDTMRIAAEQTGGSYFGNRNDLDGAMREALEETHTSYTLGYYLVDNAEPGEHKLRITVNRPGAKLRYRTSYTEDARSEPTN